MSTLLENTDASSDGLHMLQGANTSGDGLNVLNGAHTSGDRLNVLNAAHTAGDRLNMGVDWGDHFCWLSVLEACRKSVYGMRALAREA